MCMTEIIRVTPSDLNALPNLKFPFNNTPSLWAPERAVLHLDHGKRVPLFVWLHLDRSAKGPTHLYNPASLSMVRLAAIPKAIRRLSDHFRLQGTSPKTVYAVFASFARFLAWIDNEEHDGLFETVFSDPDSALQAFELYHRYIKGRIQSHSLHRRTGVNQHSNTLQVLSVIHDRKYGDEIKKIAAGINGTTKAPKSEDVAQFMSTLTSLFDSACRILESNVDTHTDGTWQLSISTVDNHQVVSLPKGYSRARLMELAAMSFTGLVIADSGANLAQVQIFEEPEDLSEQLADPDRISLTQKVVKLRAGGKAVPVTMTAVTFTRLRRFANIRHQIIELLGCDDIAPFFFKCEYTWAQGGVCESRSRVGLMEPLAVRPISDHFPVELRKKVTAAGAKLPNVTLRQLRTHKQQHLVRHHGLKVAAEAMGHTIATAVKAYCAAQEGVQANDIGRFMSSLHKTVVRGAHSQLNRLVSVPAGGCTSHGTPEPSAPAPLVQPDCKKTEGCFFCENFRVHADEEDLRKLLSCQRVLLQIGHLQGESEQADRAYGSVLERIELLLSELHQILGSTAYEPIKADIAAGNLTRYWAVKVQQLGLLGLIAQ